MVDSEGNRIETIEETLRFLMNVYFPSNASTMDDVMADREERSEEPIIDNSMVLEALKRFLPLKAAGPVFLSPHLAAIFNVCLGLTYTPKAWQEARVVFIPKPGKANYVTPKSSRSISLTSFLLKTMERTIDTMIKTSIPNDTVKYKQHAILWSLGLIAAIIIFTFVTMKILYIHTHKPLKTVISDLQRPVFKIPFPEVTLCNKNRLNWQRYAAVKEKFLRRRHHTPQHERVFMEVLNAYDTLQFGKFDNFKNLSDLYPPILLRELNYINFSHIVEVMAWRCHEILSECSWSNRTYNCCDIFSPRNSLMGLCLAFNSVESKEGMLRQSMDKYYPLSSLGSGPKNSLKLKINLREKLHSPLAWDTKGVMLMAVEPGVWSYITHEIPTSTRTTIGLSANLQVFDNTTRLFSQTVRECVFEDELKSLFYKSLINRPYMYENCQAECQQEYMTELCNCTMDLMYPPNDVYKPCRLRDLPCLYKNNRVLVNIEQVGARQYVVFNQKGINCPCYYNCKSLSYSLDVHADNLPNVSSNQSETEILLEVYFLGDSIMVYRTTAVYTLEDLMASFGGLAGLCMGCSLVGITEILFFFFFDIPKRTVNMSELSRRLKNKRKLIKTEPVIIIP
ncbi:pickpocket protein 19-like [Musca vetustissima]|uniref:pickpocket protein 19-like n=1 Tax=Musca vetustissima TaxID=27455 RepID=UPI002AB7864B|nr:pickpocket protein 19-like [Musca vetustissima]